MSSSSTSQCCTMSQAQQRRGLARGFLDPVPHIGKQEPLPPRYYARQRVVVPTPVGFHQRSLHLTPFRIARISSDASEVSIRRSLIVAALICLRRKRRNLAAHQRRCGSNNNQYPHLPVPVHRQSGRKWAVAWHLGLPLGVAFGCSRIISPRRPPFAPDLTQNIKRTMSSLCS